MLVLTRKENEAFTIGPNINVRVLTVQGDKVRIGIDAPKDIEIMRDDAVVKMRVSTALADGELSDLMSEGE